jgi:hypothetical protein
MRTLLISLTVVAMTAFIPQNQSEYVKGKVFEGYIFDEKHFVLKSIYNQKSRYTPTKQDVEVAEELLKSELSEINNPLVNQGNGCPIINKSLRKYVRQYVGFINNNGEKVIWINFLWGNKTEKCDAEKDIVFVLDGCSFYWSIEVNVTLKSLSELKINGLG